MGLKLAGGVLVLASALWYCLTAHRRAKQSQEALGRWLALLTYVRGQISCFGAPLSDILRRADPALWPPEAGRGGQALVAAMQTEAPGLPGHSGRILLELSAELGTTWRAEQLERLDHYLALLSEELAAAQGKLTEQTRLRTALSLCGTLGLLLLIW